MKSRQSGDMEVIIKKSSMARSMNRQAEQNFSATGCGEMDIASRDLHESALVAAYNSWSGAGLCNVGQFPVGIHECRRNTER